MHIGQISRPASSPSSPRLKDDLPPSSPTAPLLSCSSWACSLCRVSRRGQLTTQVCRKYLSLVIALVEPKKTTRPSSCTGAHHSDQGACDLALRVLTPMLLRGCSRSLLWWSSMGARHLHGLRGPTSSITVRDDKALLSLLASKGMLCCVLPRADVKMSLACRGGSLPCPPMPAPSRPVLRASSIVAASWWLSYHHTSTT